MSPDGETGPEPAPGADPAPAPAATTPAPAPGPAPAPAPAAAPVPVAAAPPAPAAAGAVPGPGPVAVAAAEDRRPAVVHPPYGQRPPFVPPPPGPVDRALAAFWAHGREPAGARVLGLCGAAGVAGGVLLVGQQAGLGVALAAAVVWAGALPALWRRRDVVDLVLVALSVLLVAVVAVRAAEWVVWLCLLAAAWTATSAASGARGGWAVVAAPATWVAGALRALPWVRHGLGEAVGGRRAQVLAWLRTLGLTTVLLVVFGALFASADQVFASYLPTFSWGDLPARVVVAVLVALAAAALATLALHPPAWSTARVPEGRPAERTAWLTPVVALDALVLAFVGVQVGGVLGGHRHVLETAGMSYAQYARAGFGQLVVVTVLTLLVVTVAARHAPRATHRDRVVVRAALGTLCLGTLGVVASALRRLDLYVEAFGLTRLRITVAVAEVVMGVVLVLLVAAGVRWSARWVARTVLVVAAVAVLGLAAVNPDALILRYNTTADLVVPLDVDYLLGLSADAVPAAAELDEPLRSCVLAGIERVPVDDGLGWNLARERAAYTRLNTDPLDLSVPCQGVLRP
ncbi:DUF4153 domain-containing protein [Cellulomonas oligotrophica]|uniref:DUF4173 domain-containing protein n=1 Tax=Cellulomonas oligotrophica TaxID=931536 RepID=A0A7Y9FCW2_9CELL|nr:DUF4173 domain-containing protein [Cellulomonas oligotrophica]NYD85016.1 hypothetical protein [Cellulomonas oligotrophica]GIG33720.1 hypothetical protein Col01nite_28790 [Cellulomonas oligotrophica]